LSYGMAVVGNLVAQNLRKQTFQAFFAAEIVH
jgi:hypothetical protein